MARYFGGFRDRLKKRSKHLPITTKDVEWVKVATTFTWSPAKRDYQWLEPEDYLSSFLSSSDSQYDDLDSEIQGDGSIDASMNLPFSDSGYDGSETLLSMPASNGEPEEEDTGISYIPPYDFVSDSTPPFNDEGVLRPNIDVPADLPMLDEYKLEIVSALQRRGIKIDSSKIKLPEELAAQLNGYHEGRVSIDSYELRARLQKYKRQVIESYEKFSAVSGSINPDSNGLSKSLYDEDAALDAPAPIDSNYESFVLTSLNRLEASMSEDELAFEAGDAEVGDNEILVDFSQDTSIPDLEAPDVLRPENYDVVDEANQSLDVRDSIRTTRHIEAPSDTSDILAEGLTGADLKDGSSEAELPSSYADDSWLVLPVDSRKAGQDLENPDDLDNIGEDTLVVNIHGASPDLLELEEEEGDEEVVLESNRSDSSELLKALNTINSRFPESSNDADELDLTTDLVDLDVEVLGDIGETLLSPEEPASGDFDEPIDRVEEPAIEAPAEIPPAPADETSLSDLLLQLRHEGDRSILDDANVQGEDASNSTRDDQGIDVDLESDLIIGIEPANDAISLEDLVEESAYDAGYAAPQEPVIVSRQQNDDHLEEIKPVSLDLDQALPTEQVDVHDVAEETTQAIRVAGEENPPEVGGIDTPEVVTEAKEVQKLEIPEPEVSGIDGLSVNYPGETVEQSRARFIEEERKKLYSLIGDLEETTSLAEQTDSEVEKPADSTVQESTLNSDIAQVADPAPDRVEGLEVRTDQSVETNDTKKPQSALIEDIMAAKEQLGSSSQTSSAEPSKASGRFVPRELIELSDALDEKTTAPVNKQDIKRETPKQSELTNAIVEPAHLKPEQPESEKEVDPVSLDAVATNPVATNPVAPNPIAATPATADTAFNNTASRGNKAPSDLDVDHTKKESVSRPNSSANNIIDPEPKARPLASELIGEQVAKEQEKDKASVPAAPPIAKARSFGSLGEIEPAPLPKKVVQARETSQPVTPEPVTPRPVTPRPVSLQSETRDPVTPQPVSSQPVSSQPAAEKLQSKQQSVKKAPVREESLHNAAPPSSQALDPVFSSEQKASGVDKIATPAEPSDESRVAVDQKAFKVNTLIDQSSAEKEHPALNRDELSGKGLTTKSAESEARKDVAPVETELSSNTLAGHNIESEQLRPVSIDKTFMSEPQTTEEETPAVFDASTSKPVEVVTSPTPDVESPGVVTVDLDGVGVEKEKPEEIVDEGLIEADEVQGTDVSLTQVIESLAFATEDPIPLKKIARIYSETLGVKMPTEKKMREALGKLNEEYTAHGRSYRIKEWAGGVRMASHPQYARFIRALYKDNRPKKLSRTLMETLAIIAYSQPSTKPEVDFVRGVDSDYAVRKLLELGLIDIVGRSDSIGRPLLYGTSERFLEQFGLSGIEALPKLREVEELLGDPAFKKERLQLLALEDMETGGKPNEESGDEASAKNEAGSDANDTTPAATGSNAAGSDVAANEVTGSNAAENTHAAGSVPTDVSGSSE